MGVDPAAAPVVVKVGGSLFNWPDLGPRLRLWLDRLPAAEVLLAPGGGPTADVVRALDEDHRLGEESAHWLALGALALNARFLALLLPGAVVIEHPAACPDAWRAGRLPVLDALGFARADEGRPGCLPHTWKATSDSVAARAAVVLGARRLVLLKSVPCPEGVDWAEAGRRGFVDPLFPEVLAGRSPPLEAIAVDLRSWRPG